MSVGVTREDVTREDVIRVYGPMARRIAREFFLPGSEREDVEQEAYIGLLRACRTYRPETGTPFGPFAAMCVRRWLMTCVKAANREKCRPLTESHRLASDAGIGIAASEVFEDPRAGSVVEDRDRLRNVFAEMAHLSELERSCLGAVTAGFSYSEIQADTGCGFKTVDNAIQRARRKLAA